MYFISVYHSTIFLLMLHFAHQRVCNLLVLHAVQMYVNFHFMKRMSVVHINSSALSSYELFFFFFSIYL